MRYSGTASRSASATRLSRGRVAVVGLNLVEMLDDHWGDHTAKLLFELLQSVMQRFRVCLSAGASNAVGES